MSDYGKIGAFKAPNKTMSMVVLTMALVYNVIFGFIRNPAETDNTLSWLGYDYPHGFLMWGVLTAAAFFLNIIYLYKKFGYPGRVGTAFAIAAIFFMPGVVFINDWGWEQTAHLIATLIFIALNSIAILMFFIHNYKKHIKYRITTFLVILILAGMITVQFTLGKSGLLELVPLWLALVLLFISNFTSFYPVYERDMTTGEYILDENGNRVYDYGTYRKGSYNGYNFAQSMLYDKKEYKRDAASIRGYLQITPIEGLSYKMSLNIDYDSMFTHNYSNPTYGKKPLTGSLEKGNDRTTGMTYNNVINWNHTFKEDHDVRLMAGQEYYEFNTSNFSGSRTGVITDGYFEPDVASTLSSFGGNSDQYKLLSFFGSAEYSYKSKYFVSASVRTDGSSRFHPDHRWGTFWSFGGSWKISREKFLEEASNNWLSNLTLRASYGAQGNDNVGYYAYKALYSIGSSLGESTLHASRLETPELSWETNLNLNVGLDFGFWSNRLNGTIEFFQRSSKDLLFARDLVPSSGFSSIDANIGKLKNYGWEFTISGTPVMTKDWTWKLSVNATTYKNKIVELPTEVMWQSSKKWVKGGSLYDFWLYEWAGVNPENGKPQWYYTAKDGSRQITEDYSSLTPDDKVKVGSSLPKLSGGFQSDLTWKNLSLSMLFSYAIGGKLYNNDKIQMMSVSGGNGSSMSEDMLNRWTPENRYTDIPRLSYDQTSYFTSSSSRWLVNRSFLRLKTVTLSYTLPQRWIHFATLKDASIFIQGENLLTFSHQQGLDPEQPISGVVSYRYPAMKTFSFGINVTL